MNTKFSTDRQLVFPTIVLLTAMWLPLTTVAQDYSKTVEHTHPLNSHNRVSEDSFGFAEADPSTLQSLNVPTILSRSNQQSSAGFAEYDPAGWKFPETTTFLQASNSQVQQTHAGFAEADPSAIPDSALCNMDNRKMRGFPVGKVP